MKLPLLLTAMHMVLCCASALAAPAQLSATDEAGAFKAAGFALKGKQWHKCDDASPSYEPGAIAAVNTAARGGHPVVIISEGSTNCFGNTGVGYSLVRKQADGKWQRITDGTGIAQFLSTKGADGWPDVEIGGPGFCFPVERWNGHAYALHRYQYEGKSCRP
ncbi:MAG: hypothetical protein V4484_03885 [Pseudomonadota bacterium]